MLLQFHFAGIDFAPHLPMLPSDIPDLHAFFGPMAPDCPFTLLTTCHLQCHNNANFTICLDTGCSVSSTPSIKDFEVPPVKGSFSQLCTINHVVPIEAASIIQWYIHDDNRQVAIIHVPSYLISSSG